MAKRLSGRNRRLTKKQDAVVRYLAEHPTATLHDAGLAAGYCENNPAIGAGAALRSRNVQEVLADLMENDPSLCNSALLVRLREGLDAKKKTYFAHEGRVIEEKTDEDLGIRKEYLRLAFQVKGALINKQEISGGEKPISSVDLSFLDSEKLLRLIEVTK